MRYYFNVKDGETTHDDEGMELENIAAVQNEAVRASHDLLRGSHNKQFWTGEPWLLWVTDQPSGGGNTLLTLTFSSAVA